MRVLVVIVVFTLVTSTDVDNVGDGKASCARRILRRDLDTLLF